MDLTDGYVQEIDYTHGYCGEIAPPLIDLALVSRGAGGTARGRPLRYLELGFGQGVSLNIHAAACPGEYWGVDFNRTHLENARGLTAASGSGALLFGDAFETFAVREDLPQFDVIAMHGTWSWISAGNRRVVVDLVRRHLALKGVFYVSYNCWPGWATEMPLRHLLVQHAEAAAASGKSLGARIDASLDFAESLMKAGAKYFEAHPELDAWLRDMRTRSRRYLAHEYFNRDWHPMPFSEVAQALSAAGLSFAASADIGENLDGPGLSGAAVQFLEGVSGTVMRETTKDYLADRRFRRDLFARDPAPENAKGLFERMRDLPFTLLQHPDHVPDAATLGGDRVALDAAVYRPVVEAMAANAYAPQRLRDLQQHPKCAGIPAPKLAEAALVLTGMGSLHPVQAREAIDEAAPRCKALNERILELASPAVRMRALASPVTGAGVFLAPQEMAFLRAIAKGLASEDEWARHAWESLGEGDPGVLRAEARAFARVRLPVLKALRVA